VLKLRYAILKAKCQSGKTGAYHALIAEMLRRGDVQRVYILCGSAETELRDQAHRDAKEHNLAPYTAGAIEIIFHQDFAKSALNITNALIIVDESHLVLTKSQKLHEFLGRHGITMDGRPTVLEEKNAYVLSVDATPYSEEAALYHKETPYAKHVEMLVPGDGYVGLNDYSVVDLIDSTFDLTTVDGGARFTTLLSEHPNKYALMRLSTGKKADVVETEVRRICAAIGARVLCFTADKTEVDISRPTEATGLPCLEDAPTVTTVVLLCGRLRAGKVVPKQHIAFVWEGAKNSKTDALVQGLAGRMCGYKFGDTLPRIFLPASSLAKSNGKVVVASEIERALDATGHVLPRLATNLKKPRIATAPTDGKTQCTPLRLEWDGTQLEDLAGNAGALKDEARELLRRNLHLLDASSRYTPEQKAEIRGYALAPATPLHGRHYVAESSDGCTTYYKQVLEAYKNGTTPSELITDCPEITYVITERGFAGLSQSGANHRHVYVIFYTHAAGVLPVVHLESRIAHTNGKSIFSIDNTCFTDMPVAAGIVGLSEHDLKTPTAFEAAMRAYLTLQRTSTLTVSKCIKSSGKHFRFDKAKFNWTSKGRHDVATILHRLNTDFNIKMDIKYVKGGDKHFNIESIVWA
jgi:hypothetical protein